MADMRSVRGSATMGSISSRVKIEFEESARERTSWRDSARHVSMNNSDDAGPTRTQRTPNRK